MFDTAMGLEDDIQKIRIKREGRVPFSACPPRGIFYGIAKAICIVAAYATAPGIPKQKRIAQSHPGPLHPDHRQQGLCPRPGSDTEAKGSEGSTAEETTQQYVKSRPQNSSTRHHRYRPPGG